MVVSTPARARTRAEREAKRDRQTKSEAEVLYRRDKTERRVMILELMAWAVRKAERIHADPEEARAFREELKRTRCETWGRRPWPKIEKDDRFRRYVLQIAETFSNSNGIEEAM